MPSEFASVGDSKLRPAANESTPELPPIVNNPESAPPLIEYVSVCAGRSESVAATVVIAVVFSRMLIDAIAPAPLLVIVGSLSFTGVIVMPNVPVLAEPVPSSTLNENASVKFSVPL